MTLFELGKLTIPYGKMDQVSIWINEMVKFDINDQHFIVSKNN